MTRRSSERGAAQISVAIGLTIVLVFTAMTVHVTLALYSRSVVTAAAHDAASLAASGRLQTAEQVRAHMNDLVGGLLVEPVVVSGMGPDDTVITLFVHARAPGFAGLDLASIRDIERTITIRKERFIAPTEQEEDA